MASKIDVTVTRRGFVFDNLDKVKGALALYENKGSWATTKQLEEDCRKEKERIATEGGPLHSTPMIDTAMAKMLSDSMKSSSRFIDGVCKEMTTSLSLTGSWDRHFDYDGIGTFFKTSVDVARVGQELYWLKFWAAYVGDQVEVDFAKALGREREVIHYETSIELSKKGDEWMFDLTPLLAPFRKTFGAYPIPTNEEIIRGDSITGGLVKLIDTSTHSVFLQLADAGDMAEVNPGSLTIRGKCSKNYSGKGDAYLTPKLKFILGVQNKAKRLTPVLNPLALGSMPLMAEQIKLAYMQFERSPLKAV